MSTSNSTVPAPRPQSGDIDAALDLLLARRAALAAIWTDAAQRNDPDQLLEIGGRQAELEGMLAAIRGLVVRARFRNSTGSAVVSECLPRLSAAVTERNGK